MGISREHPVKARFKRAFRLYVGRGSDPLGNAKVSVIELAKLGDMSPKTIESHMDECGNLPTLATLDFYMKALPLGFSAGYFSETGMQIAEAEEHILPDGQTFQAHIAKVMLELAEQLADQDHTDIEKRRIAPLLAAVCSQGLALSQEWKHAGDGT